MAEQSVVTEAMHRAVGVETAPRTHVVEAGAVRKFAEAIGDTNPAYRDEEHVGHGGLIAPPTFLRSLRPGPLQVAFESPYPDVLDGGSDWEFFDRVGVGDAITVTEALVELAEKSGRLGPMLMTTWETRYTNQDGATVATQRNTLIFYRAEQEEA
jgi:acyl dehydratase